MVYIKIIAVDVGTKGANTSPKRTDIQPRKDHRETIPRDIDKKQYFDDLNRQDARRQKGEQGLGFYVFEKGGGFGGEDGSACAAD